MRLVLRNKTKLIDRFGEAFYNDLIESIKDYCYCPDNLEWDRSIKREMIDVPSKSDPLITHRFAVVSETWDVVVLGYYLTKKN